VPTGEDMILFVDRAGVYHAMQPLRALRPEQAAQLTDHYRTLAWLTAQLDPPSPDQALLREMATTRVMILTLLLPTVDPEELNQLDSDRQLTHIVEWQKIQMPLPQALLPT
jgi:hypothetical protein